MTALSAWPKILPLESSCFRNAAKFFRLSSFKKSSDSFFRRIVAFLEEADSNPGVSPA
jgi:uncharacterized iron-regulated protein